LPFEFKKLEIPEVILIQPKVFEDNRGYFMETFSITQFLDNNIKFDVIQENQIYSKKSVIRGLHYQRNPFSQAKLVRVIKGEIFDVAVDLRYSSPTFGKFISVKLSEYNKSVLYIPRGFAHGFQVLSDDAIVVYLVDNYYSPKDESGIIWNDPDIKIEWPIKNPILSEKDSHWPTLKDAISKDLIFR
jgi:dTDP-4-dehydrorhamnose 3,5-epimerase